VNTDCPFCKIVLGEAPASVVYEDSAILAFMDLNPANSGHTLIIPKEHWENIYEIPEKTLIKIAPIIKRTCTAVKKATGCEGISILQLNGKAAGQVVMHYHVHVIPRFSGDIMSKTPGAIIKYHKLSPERGQLDEIAKRIHENL
jgi:histidine triad (HIT) family protein